MLRNIAKITIANELDVVLAYKRTMQLSDRCGLALPNQTKFATAVSEICRNVIEYAGEGAIQFSLTDENGILYLEALITDRGRGIGNLDHYLEQKTPVAGRGNGLIHSRILVDNFKVETESDKGTRVKLQKRIPASHPIITKAVIDGWVGDFAQESSVSPYAEMKNQNMQLIELLEQLQVKNLETEQQLQEIKRLNLELLSSHEDISNLLTEREAQTVQLQRKNQELDAFAHIVSHDLRSPLQNIKGLAMLTDAYLKADEYEEAKPVLAMISGQTNRMDNLIMDILSYSLAGKNTLPKKEINIENLLYEVMSFLDVPAGFNIQIQENMPVLLSEEIFLRQIFNNLINNAIKHHDLPNGNIFVSCTPESNFFRFTVADDGPGISPADQDRIFRQFETISNTGGSGSAGLGLSIIKKITQEKGGSVWVESEGRGSKFNFTWPVN